MSWELKSADGYVLAVNNDVVKLGRASENTIVLNDPAVSRFHLNLYIKGQDLIAEDAGSQNGFTVNGQNVKGAVKLNAGDRVGLGSKEYIVRPKSSTLNLESQLNSRISSSALGRGNIAPQRIQPIPSAYTRSMPSQSTNSRFRVYMLAIGIVAMAAIYFRGEEKNTRKPASNPAAGKGEIAEPLKMDGKEKFRQKAINEVRAEAMFRQTLRDFYNRNYSRSITGFNDVIRENPDHEEAREHLKTAETYLASEMRKLYEDAVRSNEVMQYSRAKGQAMRVLTLIAEQIPAYSRTISEGASRQPGSTSNTTQDEMLLQVPCKSYKANKTFSEEEKTQAKANITLCEESQKLLREVRQRLGDEDTLKEVR